MPVISDIRHPMLVYDVDQLSLVLWDGQVALSVGAVTIGTVDQGLGGVSAWKVDGSAVTQPVSGTFWQATQPVSGTFWQATQPVSLANATAAAQTSVADSASSVTILASNAARIGATVMNDSTATLYLRLSASAASATDYTVQLVSGAYYEVPSHYSGAITGIWASDPNTGAARVTEIT